MRHLLATLLSCVALASCGVRQAPNEIVVQRFFGTCKAEYGNRTDVENAEGECGIMTTLINRFSAENPDVKVRVSPVAWPGYNQLAAQLASGDPPDLVTMHLSAISDYQSRKLLEPLDKDLRAVGVDPNGFTAASLVSVSKQGQIYGLPIDNWAPLWHINMNYFRQAGLVKDGKPILPRSPEELLAHARQFKQATGKPYFVQALANERAAYTRNLYTLLMQQSVDFFADPQQVKLQSPETKQVVAMFRQLYVEDLTTKNQDYAAATNGFINGAGGVYLVGTWMIGDFDAESRKAGRPLTNGYAVMPWPQLYARDATFIDGHAWVMPVRDRTPRQRDAVFRLLKFLADHDFEWSRTGHLPAYKAVIESERFNALPHRSEIAKIATTGMPLPSAVQRQFPVQDIIGEEMAAAITGHKTVDAALADAEHRVNDLLFHLL
ncbi:extracellular solute-binding protein [Peristeroidobacter soli]|uniref:extracellular solute-binding protein n=1 Tax=Peristeroidobacter soli TaxID=2497877 RepID=UPI00101BC1DA|nr:extracellular solute-binding protein [Peristeroidobacter soli]